MSGPDKVSGGGKRDAAKVSSAESTLPPDDQKAYLVIDPARRGPTPGKSQQRQAAQSTGVRDPAEEDESDLVDNEARRKR